LGGILLEILEGENPSEKKIRGFLKPEKDYSPLHLQVNEAN